MDTGRMGGDWEGERQREKEGKGHRERKKGKLVDSDDAVIMVMI